MSRTGVAAICAGALVAGWVGGRITGSGSAGAVTRYETVERPVVVSAQHLGSAADPHGRGPLDLARVASVRRGIVLRTTIVASHAWRDSLLRNGRVGLSILYDVDNDGKPERRDVFRLFHGRLTSWISTIGSQGVQAADVERRSATTISVARSVAVFYSASGQAPLASTSPIGVAVVASWKGGRDRVPDRGWITVPPP